MNETLSLHTLGATNFVVGSVAVLPLSLSVATSTSVQLVGVLIIVGLVGGTFFTLSQRAGHSTTTGLGVGSLERLAGYPFNLWMVGVGVLAIAHAGAGPLPSGSRADDATRLPTSPKSLHAHGAND